MSKSQKLYLVAVVWGDLYVRNFLEICLPSQLGEQNLVALSKKFEIEYKIFTTNEFSTQIESDPAVKRLSQICKVRIEATDGVIDGDIYDAVNRFHRLAVEEASKGSITSYSSRPT